MYFSKFDSWRQAAEGKSFCFVVERISGQVVQSSPIPCEALEEALTELAEMEAGNPIQIWMGPIKTLTVIPFQQVVSVQIVFQ